MGRAWLSPPGPVRDKGSVLGPGRGREVRRPSWRRCACGLGTVWGGELSRWETEGQGAVRLAPRAGWGLQEIQLDSPGTGAPVSELERKTGDQRGRPGAGLAVPLGTQRGLPLRPRPARPTCAWMSPVFQRSLGSPPRAGGWRAGALGMVWRHPWEQWAPHTTPGCRGAEEAASVEDVEGGSPGCGSRAPLFLNRGNWLMGRKQARPGHQPDQAWELPGSGSSALT